MSIKYARSFLFCAMILAVCSCGVKPSHVDPPEGAEHSTFPQTYPDINTDPQPGLEGRGRY